MVCDTDKWAKYPVTGGRVLRFTNVSSGYPCFLVVVYGRNPDNPEVKVYSGERAPNVEGFNRKPKRMMMGFGGEMTVEYEDGTIEDSRDFYQW
jgi:hypothetical protein